MLKRIALVSYMTLPAILLSWKSKTLQHEDAESGSIDRLVWIAMLAVGTSGPPIWYYLKKLHSRKWRKSQVYLVAFWVWMATAALIAGFTGMSKSTRSTLIDLYQAASWISVYWTVNALVGSKEMLKTAILVLKRSGVVITASVYAGLILHKAFDFQFGEIVALESGFFRCFGPLGDHVGFVMVLFAILAFATGRYLESAFHLGAIFITSTRGAMISLLVGLIWLTLTNTNAASLSRKISQGIITALVIAGGLLVYGLSGVGETSANRILDTSDLSHGAGSRLNAFELAVKVWNSSPIFGTGWGGFRDSWLGHADQETLSSAGDLDRGMYYTQNQLLQTATDGGVFGVIFYLIFAATLLRESRNTIKKYQGPERKALQGLDAYLAAILFGNQSAVWLSVYSSSGTYFMYAAAIMTSYFSGKKTGRAINRSRTSTPVDAAVNGV